jgi:carnitine 3-dehydrogenase
VKPVAVVGTGVVGAAWAALFLASGLDVVATDPADGAEQRLRALVGEHWAPLSRLGLAAGASTSRLQFVSTPSEAVSNASFVQESGPERIEIKHALIAELDADAPADVVIASSTSGFGPSELQAKCTNHPERVVVGHPFNPAHLIPLVEVVGAPTTSPKAIETALAFYRSIGKQPIHVRREIPGHVANRLQAALWREAYSLVEDGIASVADVDLAISYGPGLRWALLGPLVNQHLSGGPAGLAHTLEHLGPPMVDWWTTMKSPAWTPELRAMLVRGVNEELEGISPTGLIEDRDALLELLIKAKANAQHLPAYRNPEEHS